MRTLNVTQAKKEFSSILNSRETVEVHNPKTTVVIIPKENFIELEKIALIAEAREALEKAKGKKRYTDTEVDLMLAKVLERKD